MLTFDDFKRFVLINVEKYSPSIFVSIFCSYAVARYQELTIRKTGVKFTRSHKKNISSFNYWNLFRNKFPLRCHRKTVLGCLLLKSLKVLNVSFVFFPLNNCSSELIFSQKTLVVILTCALCQQSNLLKAKSKFSINLLVPPQFKRIPLWLQWYLGFIFELFVKQIFILPHSFFGNLFTCAAFKFNLSRLGSDRLRVMMDCLSFTYVYGWHFSFLIPIKNSVEQEKDITIRFRGLQIDLLDIFTMQIQILIIMLMRTLV